MPGQQKQEQQIQQGVPPQSAATSTALSPQARFGNAYLQDQMKSRETMGQLTWKGALGESLGGKLYTALSARLTDEKLAGHAHKVVDSALGSLKKALAGQASASEAEALQLFLAELDKGMKSIATDAVTASGLGEGIREFADVHPYEIALAAAAGAVAYVLSNQDLPLLEGKLGLGGGHTLVGGIDPGRTMKLAVEQVRIGYRYQGDHVAAYLNADKYKDGFGMDGGASYSNGGTSASIAGSHTDRAGEQQSKLDLRYRTPDINAGLGLQNSVGGARPGSSVTASVSDQPAQGELQRSLSGTYRNDGSWEAAAGIGKTTKDARWAAEAFAGQDARGNRDAGVRLLFKLQF